MDPKQWLRKNPDRVGAWVAIALGALVLYLGWDGASDTAYPAEQLPYIISGGIGGALLVALGATLLISADLRDEWRKLDRIERRLTPADADEVPEAEAPPAPDDPSPEVAADASGELVTTGNGRRSRSEKVSVRRSPD
jgi:hypothetical protein